MQHIYTNTDKYFCNVLLHVWIHGGCVRHISYIHRVGQNHIYTIYGEYTVFFAGKSPNIRSYTVCIYGSGQPYIYTRTRTNIFAVVGLMEEYMEDVCVTLLFVCCRTHRCSNGRALASYMHGTCNRVIDKCPSW